MKRKFPVLSLLLFTIVLTGCISIPFGDKVLEISMDGVEFVTQEEGGALADNNVNEELNNLEDETTNDTEAEGDVESSQDDAVKNCEEQDHSTVTEDLPVGFFIPDCALVTSVSKNSHGIDAYFTVEEGDWQDVFNAYKEFFGDSLNQERQDPASGKAELDASLYENPNNYTIIQIEQLEEDVQIRIIQQFPTEE